MRPPISMLPGDEHQVRINCSANPHLTLRVHRERAALFFEVADFGGHPHVRVSDVINYLRVLHHVGCQSDPAMAADQPPFIFQADDNPHHFPSVSWERMLGWSEVKLVPDIYYFAARGYDGYLPRVPEWINREDCVIWRGSSTGILNLSEGVLDQLPRYRLAKMARHLGASADVGFTSIVQAESSQEELSINRRIDEENLRKPYVDMAEMANYRYVVDIDGNANSWNLIQKLRLGCCLLKVDSQYEQWFYDRMEPGYHYLPIKADLSDFAAQLEWARSNPLLAREIAQNGRRLSIEMTFDSEMLRAARRIFLPA